jgi:hypothetical protein
MAAIQALAVGRSRSSGQPCAAHLSRKIRTPAVQLVTVDLLFRSARPDDPAA